MTDTGMAGREADSAEDRGADEALFHARFAEIPNAVLEMVREHLPAQEIEVLDFGCGAGSSALGFALKPGVKRVVGVDIIEAFEGCAGDARQWIGLPGLPPNLHFHRIEPGRLHDAEDQFDLIYSWSVMEHLDDALLSETVAGLRRALKPGGVLFVMAGPLYHSSEGSYCFHVLPERWAHLLHDDTTYERMLAEATEGGPAYEFLRETHRRLNRLTAPRLARLLEEGGFEILTDVRQRESHPPPSELLLAHGQDDLQTHTAVMVARHAQAPASPPAAEPAPVAPDPLPPEIMDAPAQEARAAAPVPGSGALPSPGQLPPASPRPPASTRAQETVVRYDATRPQRISHAMSDIGQGFARWRLAWALARGDITERYRGSVLGPLWITLSTGLMLALLGFLYAKLFQMDLTTYLPWLSVSLVLWGVVGQCVTDAGSCMTSAEAVIRQMRLPFTLHALRSMFRNALIAAHTLPLIAVVLAIFGIRPGWDALMAIPGLLLLAACAFWAGLLLGVICARFRDIPPIIASLMQIAFFMTPIIWKPELIGSWQAWLPLNPFHSLMETIRAPLLGMGFPLKAWLAALSYGGVLSVVAFAVFARFRGRIAFWI